MPRDETDDLSDAVLLRRYAAGDGQVAARLCARHLPRVFRHARRLLGDAAAAEDVAQEAMMRLWKVAPDWREGEAKIDTWLYSVTANLCTDQLRRRRTVGLDAAAEAPDPGPDVASRLQTAARRDALQAALDSLPERQREAVILRHMEGLANPQIAEIMGLGTRAVESLVARGKRGLAVLLARRRAELGFDDDG